MSVLIGMAIINIVLSLLVYGGWHKINMGDNMVALYDRYGVENTRLIMSVVMLLLGTPLMVVGILMAVAGRK